MANFKQTVRNMVGTKLPPRFAGQKLGVKAPGALAKVPGGLPGNPAAAISPFTVQDAPASYRDFDVPVASWLSGVAVEDDGVVYGLAGLGEGFMDGQTLGVPNKYLVYGGAAVVVLGGVAIFMRRRGRRAAQPAVAGLASLHRRSSKRRRRR